MTFLQAITPRIRRRSWPIGQFARPLINSNGIFWERVYKTPSDIEVSEYFYDAMTVPGNDWEVFKADGGADV